jgi:response regulator RpfG family c-di-GMP phosphodiesterase
MQRKVHHRAYGEAIESLDVVVVDDAKPMQNILRSILHACRVARVRCFDNAEDALQSMLVEPPHLVITDWVMQPTDGLALVATMRRAQGAIALVPAILLTAHPTRALIERAIAAGVHYVVAKPIAPATLVKRLEAIITDGRVFEPDAARGAWRLEGAAELLAAQKRRAIEIAAETDLPRRLGEARPRRVPEPPPSQPKLPGFGARRKSPVPVRGPDGPQFVRPAVS